MMARYRRRKRKKKSSNQDGGLAGNCLVLLYISFFCMHEGETRDEEGGGKGGWRLQMDFVYACFLLCSNQLCLDHDLLRNGDFLNNSIVTFQGEGEVEK